MRYRLLSIVNISFCKHIKKLKETTKNNYAVMGSGTTNMTWDISEIYMRIPINYLIRITLRK